MKHLNILLLCLLIPLSSYSKERVKFSSDNWNFGLIKEDGGEVSHTFTLENRGKEPIVILNITTSCGCTNPEYSRRPIAAGSTSEIKITFDPEYRPGVFSKGIEIFTSASDSPLRLTISGEVSPRELSLAEQFPYHIGEGLYASRLFMAIGQVDHTIYQESMIELYNASEQSVELELRALVESGFLRVNAPKRLATGEKAQLHAGYLVSYESGYYGKLNDELEFVVNNTPSLMILKIRAFTTEKADE